MSDLIPDAVTAAVPPHFKVYVVMTVLGFSPRYDNTVVFDCTGIQESHDDAGYHARFLTLTGWNQYHSPNPIQWTRNAADIDRLTPPLT